MKTRTEKITEEMLQTYLEFVEVVYKDHYRCLNSGGEVSDNCGLCAKLRAVWPNLSTELRTEWEAWRPN